jgi:uncharacterized protein YceK
MDTVLSVVIFLILILFAYFYYTSNQPTSGGGNPPDDHHDDDKPECTTSIACFPNTCVSGKCSTESDLSLLIVVVQANIKNLCDSIYALSAGSPGYFDNTLAEITNVQNAVSINCKDCIPNLAVPFSGVIDNRPAFEQALKSLMDLNLPNGLNKMLPIIITSDIDTVKSNLDAINSLNLDISTIIQNMFTAMNGMWGYEYIHSQNLIAQNANQKITISLPIYGPYGNNPPADYYALTRYVRFLLIIHDLVAEVRDNAVILTNSITDAHSALMRIYYNS